jgi:RNA-directed DNA polymerase
VSSDKSLPITKAMVWKAYQLVKRNGKAAGVDGQSLEDFAMDLKNNLYKIWNRMASGSYFPPPVRRVEIPKSGGGSRPLGIPTVADRVAQMVVKQVLEQGRLKVSHKADCGAFIGLLSSVGLLLSLVQARVAL